MQSNGISARSPPAQVDCVIETYRKKPLIEKQQSQCNERKLP